MENIMVDEHMASDEVHNDGFKPASEGVKPVEAGPVGDKVAADAEAGKAEENRRREVDMPVAAEVVEPAEPMTAGEAKVMTPVGDADIASGHHFAQKFDNDPANPAHAEGMAMEDLEDGEGVMLSLESSGEPRFRYTRVHPGMVGDYLRAGWSLYHGH